MSDTWKNVAAQWLTSGLEESLPTKTLPREISTKFIISFYFNPLLAGWSYLCFFPKSTTSYLLVWKKATSQRLNWSFLQLLIRGYYAKCSMATPFALIYHCCPAIIQVAFIEKYFIRQIISGSWFVSARNLKVKRRKKCISNHRVLLQLRIIQSIQIVSCVCAQWLPCFVSLCIAPCKVLIINIVKNASYLVHSTINLFKEWRSHTFGRHGLEIFQSFLSKWWEDITWPIKRQRQRQEL